jgi:hypothetical protein
MFTFFAPLGDPQLLGRRKVIFQYHPLRHLRVARYSAIAEQEAM